ncbi:MAG: AAA family ATPase [Nanoarchaeota archaeon]
MIIGVVGPLCAGKDSFAFLLQNKGFALFSFGDVIRKEMHEKGLVLERTEIQKYGNFIRSSEGAGAIARRILQLIGIEKGNYIVQGFRNPAEVEAFMAQKDFILVALSASQEARFERMKQRKREKDPTTFEAFKKIDDMELLGVGQNEDGFNIGECMKMANFKINNDGSILDLEEKINILVQEIKGD